MFLFLLALLSPSAEAYELFESEFGNALAWQGMPIKWSYNDAESVFADDRMALNAAFDTWANVPESRIAFNYVGATDAAQPEHDRVNAVYWEPDWVWDPDAVALASTWSDQDGVILAFDMRINASDSVAWSTDGSVGFDLQSAVTHEVGHVLGLHHSATEAATMFATHLELDTSRRVLHWDDEDGARFLYPPSSGKAETKLALLGCSHSSTLPASSLALMLVVVATRRRE